MGLRWTDEEYREWKRRNAQEAAEKLKEITSTAPDQPRKRSKYGNQRVEVDGWKFDSIHEADVYRELKMRQQAGELKTVLRQVGFDLPGGIRYFADFVTVGMDDKITVYDAKSEATKKNRVYINKKKQMRACCGLDIVEV
ncbi:MAG: DUF1064 domain-containing protein [Clostridia bacterium]|nr:DUF1064 domain-containing protein [Clostridia bacterium]